MKTVTTTQLKRPVNYSFESTEFDIEYILPVIRPVIYNKPLIVGMGRANYLNVNSNQYNRNLVSMKSIIVIT